MTASLVIDVLNEFVEAHPEVPLVSDTGDCLFASVEIRSNEIVAPAYYATMGFAVPAAIGVQTSTGRRPLVLMGDGAFQMTGPEISHAPGYGCNPVIVLVNNTRWEMLQAFYPHAGYNDTVSWPFAKLAELWGGNGYTASTVGDLRRSLAEAWASPRFSIVEVPVARGDISPVLARFVQAFKERVYRPREKDSLARRASRGKVVNITTFGHMGKAISAAQANREFSAVLRRVRRGQSFVVTSHGRPVAKIVPVSQERRSRDLQPAALFTRLAAGRVQSIGRWRREELYEDARREPSPSTRTSWLTPRASTGREHELRRFGVLRGLPAGRDAHSGAGARRSCSPFWSEKPIARGPRPLRPSCPGATRFRWSKPPGT